MIGVKKVLNGETCVAGQVTGIRPQSGMLRQGTKSNFRQRNGSNNDVGGPVGL